MQRFEVELALEGVREAREKWAKAQREFVAGVNKVMYRLLHEAARNRMSVADVAGKTGMTKHSVRNRMLAAGLNPRDGKTLLADNAAKALAGNAELLGIQPHEMDLMSPLAYLPMGDQMRRDLEKQTAPSVAEFPETDPATVLDQIDTLVHDWLTTSENTDREVLNAIVKVLNK